MNNAKLTAEIVADHVLRNSCPASRRAAAQQLVIYALSALVAIDDERSAAEFAYRAADAVVAQ